MATRPSRTDQNEKKRKTRKRAVLQFRIPEADYRELAKTAAKQDLTISELAARRLLTYPMLADEVETSDKILDGFVRKIHADEELEKRGYRTIALRLAPSEVSISILTSMELAGLLTKAAQHGAELAFKQLQVGNLKGLAGA
ncbi:hypothetical protein [Bradyrhizobium sp. McL0616]|uniref:hypothetical protein n=1 Tax=Bradyrhizobium sp. McL0616 TaxID=3415674 RepID=UPI003CF57EAB